MIQLPRLGKIKEDHLNNVNCHLSLKDQANIYK